MRIAVLTFHRSRNCGAMLQAYAMRKVLEGFGHEVWFPACCGKKYSQWEPLFKKGLSGWAAVKQACRQLYSNVISLGFNREAAVKYTAFANRWFPSSDLKPEQFAGNFDAAVIGSDQVWSRRLTGKRTRLYTGRAIPAAVRMVSYAASCGDQLPQDGSLDPLRSDIRRFHAISVREAFLKEKIEHDWNLRAELVADPSLLIDAEEYREAESLDLVPSKPYVLVFYVRSRKFPRQVAHYLRRKTGLKVLLVPGRIKSRLDKPKGAVLGVSPDRFLGLFANARAVVASSFHATAFSIIYNKPFVALQNSEATVGSRSYSLLSTLGIADRFVSCEDDLARVPDLLAKPIPSSAYDRLKEFRESSKEWLRQALT